MGECRLCAMGFQLLQGDRQIGRVNCVSVRGIISFVMQARNTTVAETRLV